MVNYSLPRNPPLSGWELSTSPYYPPTLSSTTRVGSPVLEKKKKHPHHDQIDDIAHPDVQIGSS